MTTSSAGPTSAAANSPTNETRQRQRAARGVGKGSSVGSRLPSPPRQRRPAMAALAVLLIVGCALIAGVLAVRMDSRSPVLAAAHDIEPGTKITAADLKSVDVAADGSNLIGRDYAGQVVGTYAQATIHQGQLLDDRMLTHSKPIGNSKAVVGIVASPPLDPTEYVEPGDLVQVIYTNSQSGQGKVLCTGYVISVTLTKGNSLGGSQSGQHATLLVPRAAAKSVVDASGGNKVGIAVLSRGQSVDVPLQVGG